MAESEPKCLEAASCAGAASIEDGERELADLLASIKKVPRWQMEYMAAKRLSTSLDNSAISGQITQGWEETMALLRN